MLKLEHIINLKLDKNRLLAHTRMPPPGYSTKTLTRQIAAIGDAVISELLQIPVDTFEMQLAAARDFSSSYIMPDSNDGIVGIAAATSLIKNGDIMFKNLIVPMGYLRKHECLAKQYIISIFLRGEVKDGIIPGVSSVEVAGWTDTEGLNKNRIKGAPTTFNSRLSVAMMPCTQLNPMSELTSRLASYGVCV